jgi:hypothetical protein
VQTYAKSTCSYLYLNGIAVDRETPLSDNVTLLPAKADCDADLFLGLGKSDVDISVISLFLPHVGAQLRITGLDAKEVGIRSWNSIWDGLVIGAIADAEVMANLQSDVPAEQLRPDSHVLVTNYHLRGFGRGAVVQLTERDRAWIESNFTAAISMLEQERFRNAIHCLSTYKWHSLPRARLALIWAGIEGLFGVDSELVFRISLHMSKFLVDGDKVEQATTFKRVKDLYKLRSKAVHGGEIKGDPNEAVTNSCQLLRELVRKCAESQALPNPDQLTF